MIALIKSMFQHCSVISIISMPSNKMNNGDIA